MVGKKKSRNDIQGPGEVGPSFFDEAYVPPDRKPCHREDEQLRAAVAAALEGLDDSHPAVVHFRAGYGSLEVEYQLDLNRDTARVQAIQTAYNQWLDRNRDAMVKHWHHPPMPGSLEFKDQGK